MVSVACDQPQYENIKWKIPGVTIYRLLYYTLLCGLMKSHAILLTATWDVNHAFGVFMLYILPAHYSVVYT